MQLPGCGMPLVVSISASLCRPVLAHPGRWAPQQPAHPHLLVGPDDRGLAGQGQAHLRLLGSHLASPAGREAGRWQEGAGQSVLVAERGKQASRKVGRVDSQAVQGRAVGRHDACCRQQAGRKAAARLQEWQRCRPQLVSPWEVAGSCLGGGELRQQSMGGHRSTSKRSCWGLLSANPGHPA